MANEVTTWVNSRIPEWKKRILLIKLKKDKKFRSAQSLVNHLITKYIEDEPLYKKHVQDQENNALVEMPNPLRNKGKNSKIKELTLEEELALSFGEDNSELDLEKELGLL